MHQHYLECMNRQIRQVHDRPVPANNDLTAINGEVNNDGQPDADNATGLWWGYQGRADY